MMDTDSQIPSSQSDKALPMVVHLRGDEECVEDFLFDAQAAMEFLGIKRSRLTQISGKELRVGRIRQDRYVRPVYRKIDLDDYQSWTRKTASHQSSSQAIETAVEKLEGQCQRLEEHTIVGLKESFLQLEKRVLKLLLGFPEAHKNDLQRAAKEIKGDVYLHGASLGRQSQKSFESLKVVLCDMRDLKTELERMAELQAQFHEITHENSVATRRIHEYLGRLEQSLQCMEEKLSQRIDASHAELMGRIDGVQRVFAKLEAGLDGVTDRLSQIDKKIDSLAAGLVASEHLKEPQRMQLRAKRNRRVGASRF